MEVLVRFEKLASFGFDLHSLRFNGSDLFRSRVSWSDVSLYFRGVVVDRNFHLRVIEKVRIDLQGVLFD